MCLALVHDLLKGVSETLTYSNFMKSAVQIAIHSKTNILNNYKILPKRQRQIYQQTSSFSHVFFGLVIVQMMLLVVAYIFIQCFWFVSQKIKNKTKVFVLCHFCSVLSQLRDRLYLLANEYFHFRLLYIFSHGNDDCFSTKHNRAWDADSAAQSSLRRRVGRPHVRCWNGLRLQLA